LHAGPTRRRARTGPQCSARFCTSRRAESVGTPPLAGTLSPRRRRRSGPRRTSPRALRVCSGTCNTTGAQGAFGGCGMIRRVSVWVIAVAAMAPWVMLPASALEMRETPFLADRVGNDLPPVAERIPAEPLVVDLEASGRKIGKPGGTIETMIGRSRDVRLINVWGYARLVGWNEEFELVPDILESVEVEGDQVFTLHLRKGHKWSDGHPFTAEDFRFFY